MRTAISAFILSAIPLFACPEIEKSIKTYIEQNHGGEEDKPSNVEHTVIPVNPKVYAVQLQVPVESEDKMAAPKFLPSLLFFAGTTQCDFVFQAEGEFTEALEAGGTKYVLAKTEDGDLNEKHTNTQVLIVRANGEVAAARDQHGSEIYFADTVQARCEGKVGEVSIWSRDATARDRITLRQRHTDRDGKCRVTEDASTYKYYRLTPQYWELDEGGAEIPVVEKRH